MSFQRELFNNYTELWHHAMLRMKSRLDSIYKIQGVQVKWKWESSFVRGIGVVQDLSPNIIYQRPPTLGKIPFDAMLTYRKEYAKAEDEFLTSLNDSIARTFSKEFVQTFDIEKIGKIVKALDNLASTLETLKTTQENLITTRQAKSYALHADYFKKRMAWQSRAREVVS
jgi:hypothetical protein